MIRRISKDEFELGKNSDYQNSKNIDLLPGLVTVIDGDRVENSINDYILRTDYGMLRFCRDGNHILLSVSNTPGNIIWIPITLDEFDEMVKIVYGEE